MLLVVILCLLQFTCGFLLGNGNSTISGKQTYLTASQYYSDKVQIQQQLAQVASHGELDLLASQLESKLDAFEQKLLSQTSTSASQSSIAELERKYQAMAQQLSTLEQKNKALEKTVVTKEQEITELKQNLTQEMTKVQKLTEDMTQVQNITKDVTKVQMQTILLENQTASIQQKVGALEHLKSVIQIQTLHNLEQQTQTLTNKVDKLESTEQARGQDFVALYNKVNTVEMKETEASIKLENITKQHTLDLEGLENRTQTDIRLQNESLFHLQQYVEGKLQPVILTACNKIGYAFPGDINSPLIFPRIVTSVGVTDQAHFLQTGRFMCSSPGYYYVTTTLESYTDVTYIAIMVNNDVKHRQYVTGKPGGAWTPGTTGVTLHLTTGDEVWIKHLTSRRDFYESCFTIFKIK